MTRLVGRIDKKGVFHNDRPGRIVKFVRSDAGDRSQECLVLLELRCRLK